jgi:hypothetical protein
VPGLDSADAVARSDSGRVRLGDDAAAGMIGGPRLSATAVRESGWRGLAAAMGRKASWAAVFAARAGLERLAGPGLQRGKSRPRLLLMLGC